MECLKRDCDPDYVYLCIGGADLEVVERENILVIMSVLYAWKSNPAPFAPQKKKKKNKAKAQPPIYLCNSLCKNRRHLCSPSVFTQNDFKSEKCQRQQRSGLILPPCERPWQHPVGLAVNEQPPKAQQRPLPPVAYLFSASLHLFTQSRRIFPT